MARTNMKNPKNVRDYLNKELIGRTFRPDHIPKDPKIRERGEWRIRGNPRFYTINGTGYPFGSGNLYLSVRYEGENSNFWLLWGSAVSDKEITPGELEVLTSQPIGTK